MGTIRVVLVSLTIKNFMGSGLDEQTFNFQPGGNDIYGPNGSGKTRIATAERFLLTGKNLMDETKFDIKDQKFPERKEIETLVRGVFMVNGKEEELTRIYQEKWTRPKQGEVSVYDSNETKLFINGVPKIKKDFDAYVATWASDQMMKILSDPLFFNTDNGAKWGWKDRRDKLIALAGPVSDEEAFDDAGISKERRKILEEQRATGKSMDDYKKQVQIAKSKAKEELAGIPKSIQDQKEVMPAKEDWDAIPALQEAAKADYEKINNLFNDASKVDDKKAQKLIDLRTKIRNKKADAQEIEDGLKRKLSKDNETVREKRGEIDDKKYLAEKNLEYTANQIDRMRKAIETEKQNLDRIKDLHAKRKAEPAPIPNPKDAVCPTCGHELEKEKVADTLEKQISNWKTSRATALKSLGEQAVAKDKEITELKAELQKLQTSKEELEKTIQDAQAELDALPALKKQSDLDGMLLESDEYQTLIGEIKDLEASLKALESEKDEDKEAEIADLKVQRDAANQKQIDLASRLANKATYERIEKKIKDLQEQETRLNKIIATNEGLETAITKFNIARNNLVTQKVNRMFRVDEAGRSVTFKMFGEKNNGEVDGEDCVLYFDGKPWSALNNAAKVRAGLECIYTFNERFDIYLPVFIDNHESVSSRPKMNTQVIGTYVGVVGDNENDIQL